MRFFLLFLATTLIFFLIDMVWLGYLAKDLYHTYLGYIMARRVNWAAAGVFYALYILGMLYFVIWPSIQQGSWASVLLNGALLGGLCYATYDLTNLATLKDWPLRIVVIDIAWGMFLTGATCVGAFWVGKRFLST